MNIFKDNRTILTLDAGGTNLVFSAIKAGEFLGEEIKISAEVKTLDEFLDKLILGFQQTKDRVGEVHAISFAFPGPADYKNGIIGDLENLPVFKDGVALGPFLENYFNIPVFINNDGDLFTLGESVGGFLPDVNKLLQKNSSKKIYKNLIGVTLGTGFGAGLVQDNKIIEGDNSASAEINRMSNTLYLNYSVEESVSIRGVKRVYASETAIAIEKCPEPSYIYKIAIGQEEGNKEAALKSFKNLAIAAADAIANSITMFDGLVVIGGGLSGAHSIILPVIVEELNKQFSSFDNSPLQRMEVFAYNMNDTNCSEDFLRPSAVSIKIPRSDKSISYNPVKKIGIGISKLGTTKAIAVGAYTYALTMLK